MVTKCLWFSLKTGTIIVGILGIFFSTIGIVLGTGNHDDVDNEFTREKLRLTMAFCYTALVVCGLLIYGATMESPYFLLPWLVLTSLELGFLSLGFVIVLLSQGIFLGVLLCVLGLLWYIWYCILCYFKQLKRSRQPQAEMVAPVQYVVPQIVTCSDQPPNYEEAVQLSQKI